MAQVMWLPGKKARERREVAETAVSEAMIERRRALEEAQRQASKTLPKIGEDEFADLVRIALRQGWGA